MILLGLISQVGLKRMLFLKGHSQDHCLVFQYKNRLGFKYSTCTHPCMWAPQLSPAVPTGWELKAASGIPSESTVVSTLPVWDHWPPMPTAISLVSAHFGTKTARVELTLYFMQRWVESGWVRTRAEDHTVCQHEIQGGISWEGLAWF